MKSTNWLNFSFAATILWGIWGAFAGLPSQHGFPETLIFVVWAITMVPPAIYCMSRVNWKLNRTPSAIALGLTIGLLGAGGQMALFYAVKDGPTYLIFPIISMSPVITIALSFLFLKERTGKFGVLGIVLAICALPLFDYTDGESVKVGGLWFFLALGILLAWGLQAYFIKLANASMDAESIFFYMMISGILVIPIALASTDFTQAINWGWQGPYLATAIQMLNALGALALVYAFRYGKAIVVSPLVNAGAPLLTTIIGIALAASLPATTKLIGVFMALLAALLLALQPDDASQ